MDKSLDMNDKGEYALWDKVPGKDEARCIGYSPMEKFQGALVIPKIRPILSEMVAAAFKDGINLTLAVGFRPYSKQYALRKQNVIDKTKENDDTYLRTADSAKFQPKTAKPGFSNHQDGGAYDFNVTGLPKVYAWLVKNAIHFGFIRTVGTTFNKDGSIASKGEPWHWEYLPGKDQFSVVPKTDPSWQGLV